MRRFMTCLVLVLPLALATQTAQADGSVAVGLGAGVVMPEDSNESPLWLTANLRFAVSDNFVLEPEAGWYRHSESFLGTDIHLDVINLGGSGLFLIPTEKVDAFAGGGAGAHIFNVSGGGSGDSHTEFGFHFLGGLDLKVSETLKLFGAARYEIVQFEGEDLKQWKFYAGVRFGGSD